MELHHRTCSSKPIRRTPSQPIFHKCFHAYGTHAISATTFTACRVESKRPLLAMSMSPCCKLRALRLTLILPAHTRMQGGKTQQLSPIRRLCSCDQTSQRRSPIWYTACSVYASGRTDLSFSYAWRMRYVTCTLSFTSSLTDVILEIAHC